MPSPLREPHIVSNLTKIAERLLAHARLCRHIAEQTWSEDTARKLDALADECVRAAAALTQDERPSHTH